MSRDYDRRIGAHVATAPRALKPIHEKIILGVRMLEGGGRGCTAGEVLDLLKAGGEERTEGSLAQLLTYLVNRELLRRVGIGRYALAVPVEARPARASASLSAISRPTKAQLMAGRAR